MFLYLLIIDVKNPAPPVIKEYSDSCGNIYNLPESCGDPSYSVLCEGNTTVLYLYYGRHLVQAITPTNSSTLKSTSAGVGSNSCLTVSSNFITYNNFEDDFLEKLTYLNDYNHYYPDAITFISCENPMLKGIAAPCTGYNSWTRKYIYVLPHSAEVWEVANSCSIEIMVNVWSSGPTTCNENCSYPEILTEELNGTVLRWQPNHCGEWQKHGENCRFHNDSNLVLCAKKFAAYRSSATERPLFFAEYMLRGKRELDSYIELLPHELFKALVLSSICNGILSVLLAIKELLFMNLCLMALLIDFGLAKLYPVEDSIVALTRIRGTKG
ncbi:hypothetical protein L6164_036839 [Bauhinia variegata]|uniref:Uncharacterized protein n=1 Tax=Bauhinia variegata TaxID=167791 RepID=A0ACB9KJ16_BAUVA|nr:hypothetical protein L6164_036839 [Bauhinia variegata]